jgi:tRNA-splicing ligase RtcB
MSRTKARKQFRTQTLLHDMAERGIYVRAVSKAGLTEEAGAAYKDIDEVVDTVQRAGVSRRVVRLLPIGNVKG